MKMGNSITQLVTRTIAAAGALAMGLALTACGGDTSSTANGSGSNTGSNDTDITFMLDWTPNTNHIGLYVAQQLGYYKDENVNLKILPTAQAGAEASVESGVANTGFTTMSNVAAFNAQGSHLKFFFDLTQKEVARWCALASRTDIKTPKDFDGKTFVSFGSAEQTAVMKQMIKHAGGKGDFKTASVGTSTFQTLTSGQGDFGGFYETWEGVESRLNGPALNCFVASDWGVPGNPDELGFATTESWANEHKDLLQRFVDATSRGYAYALAHPDEAADILVKQASDANLDSKLTKESMKTIVDGDYWGDTKKITAALETAGESGKPKSTDAFKDVLGVTNTTTAQDYFDFLFSNGVYVDSENKPIAKAPQAKEISTNEFTSKA